MYKVLLHSLDGLPDFPTNEYEYSVNRDALLDAERQFENRDFHLSNVSLAVFSDINNLSNAHPYIHLRVYTAEWLTA